MKCAAPESAWRTTNMSAAIASRLRKVSNSVSPLLVDEVETFSVITSADKRWAASSKVVRVRVEFSKNTLHTVLPRNNGTFFTARAPTSRNESAVSRISVSSSRASRPETGNGAAGPVIELQRALGVERRHRNGLLKGGGEVLKFERQRLGAGQLDAFIRCQRQGSADHVRTHRQLSGVQSSRQTSVTLAGRP